LGYAALAPTWVLFLCKKKDLKEEDGGYFEGRSFAKGLGEEILENEEEKLLF
jgi:hypothetical protein